MIRAREIPTAQAKARARAALEKARAKAKLEKAAPALLAAAQKVLAGLNARIDAAPSNAVPVFDGIAELHTAIGKATV